MNSIRIVVVFSLLVPLVVGCAGLNTNLTIEPDIIPNDLGQLATQMESAVSVAELGFYVLEVADRARGTSEDILTERREKFEKAVEILKLAIESIRELDAIVDSSKS